MTWLSDEAVSRLRVAAALPDFSGTRYRLIERLGSGGMGTVYLAEDSVLARRVALKVLDLDDAGGEFAARLLQEARILARLEHPGIVPVHDAGTLPDGRPFYAMKFVEGQRLDRILEKPGAVSDRLRILIRVCDAVAFAHARGVIHRDLKPENIMVGSFGEVLVMDWGIAKILPCPPGSSPETSAAALPAANQASLRSMTTTGHGTVLGTPGFIAPEQFRGEAENVDQRADVYSLGAILQLAISSGRSRMPSSVPRALGAIARKAMTPEPRDRYDSAGSMGRDIARYLDGLSVSALPENFLGKTRRWARRYRVAIALVLTYLLVRALLLFWLHR